MLFEQAIAAAPLTLPAHSTLFTGLLPPRHGVRDNGGYVLDPEPHDARRAAEGRGWQTGAFVGAFVLDSKWGLNQGFDTYFDKFDVSKYKSVSLGDVARRGGEVVDERDAVAGDARRRSASSPGCISTTRTPLRSARTVSIALPRPSVCRRDRLRRLADRPRAAMARHEGAAPTGRSSSPSAITARA